MLFRSAQLKIVTTDDETIVGELFAFDSGFVALVQEPSGDADGRFTFKIVNASLVKQVSLVNRPSESKLCESIGDISKNLTPEFIERTKEVERKALILAIREANQINPEASPLGQQIFNAISKTFPCQWDALSIVVLGEVTIPPPYEKCVGKEGDALQRV